eukprot:264836-Rhodomonas_salina.1
MHSEHTSILPAPHRTVLLSESYAETRLPFSCWAEQAHPDASRERLEARNLRFEDFGSDSLHNKASHLRSHVI